ncbi:MAG: endonuclease/exonuclease/phosphatase family protein [Kofleriaceae bacterium]|nr:endonuclease/exonuclease/phosphatase family protein [Kofleriaceae bacterium]MCL4226269.1 endonuclease/exonuclease/phosphatase family protein [Myxococcales bacterium]
MVPTSRARLRPPPFPACLAPTAVAATVALAALTAACGGDDGGGDIDARTDATVAVDAAVDGAATHPDLPETLPSPLPSGPVALKVATFNAGLVQLVKAGPQRIAPIQAALAGLDADVICLQELYTQYTDPAVFAEALAATFPYAWYETSVVNPLGNGLAILSKRPLYRGRHLRYVMNDSNNVVDRAVIAATVVDAAGGYHAHVLCTHIQAGLDGAGVTRRQAQLAELGAFVTAQGYAGAPAILLGDFNAGPDPDPGDDECSDDSNCAPTCLGADTASYAAMATTYGWDDPASTLFSACTSCRDQFVQMATLNLFPCEPSQRIDHCFTRNLAGAAVTAITRELDDPVSISGAGGTAMWLSDHYAVRCVID